MFKKIIKKGFTLIELLVTITIVAILATIAVPIYINYTKEAEYAELLRMSQGLKPYVEACIQRVGSAPLDYAVCSSGSEGIPIAYNNLVDRIVGVSGGIITGSGTGTRQVILTPAVDPEGYVEWNITCNGDANNVSFCP